MEMEKPSFATVAVHLEIAVEQLVSVNRSALGGLGDAEAQSRKILAITDDLRALAVAGDEVSPAAMRQRVGELAGAIEGFARNIRDESQALSETLQRR